jgi:hypothetical protein
LLDSAVGAAILRNSGTSKVGADTLVIHHLHLLYEGDDMRREWSDVPADIGVVGAFDERPTADQSPPTFSASAMCWTPIAPPVGASWFSAC